MRAFSASEDRLRCRRGPASTTSVYQTAGPVLACAALLPVVMRQRIRITETMSLAVSTNVRAA
jgi:hypothetical protein